MKVLRDELVRVAEAPKTKSVERIGFTVRLHTDPQKGGIYRVAPNNWFNKDLISCIRCGGLVALTSVVVRLDDRERQVGEELMDEAMHDARIQQRPRRNEPRAAVDRDEMIDELGGQRDEQKRLVERDADERMRRELLGLRSADDNSVQPMTHAQITSSSCVLVKRRS